MPGHMVHVVVGGRVVTSAATQVWDVHRVALHPGNHSATDSKQPCHPGSASAMPSRFLMVNDMLDVTVDVADRQWQKLLNSSKTPLLTPGYLLP